MSSNETASRLPARSNARWWPRRGSSIRPACFPVAASHTQTRLGPFQTLDTTATREPFRYNGRLTELINSGKLFTDVGLPAFTPDDDRAMLCGSPSMLADTRALLEARGFQASPQIGTPGHYVFERAFVEK